MSKITDEEILNKISKEQLAQLYLKLRSHNLAKCIENEFLKNEIATLNDSSSRQNALLDLAFSYMDDVRYHEPILHWLKEYKKLRSEK